MEPRSSKAILWRLFESILLNGRGGPAGLRVLEWFSVKQKKFSLSLDIIVFYGLPSERLVLEASA